MNHKKINIYKGQPRPGDDKKCEIIFYPFSGRPLADPADPDRNRFAEYLAHGKDYFNLAADMGSCDLAVWPESWRPADVRIQEFVAQTEQCKKPAVFFFNNDSAERIDVGENFVFRTSFYHSRKNKHEFAVPGFSVDFVKDYCAGELPIRAKGHQPVVGYCGYAARAIWPLRIKKMLTGPDGWIIRSRAINNIIKSRAITSNFVIRNGFWGGVYKNGRQIDYQKISEVRREFVANMINSDYVICARGRGNFSYRLYETLSLGRIPVFINTDCVLPYEEYIPWREICVWVEADDIKNVSRQIIDFHNSLTAADFINLQKKCRLVWEEWLSPNGFFKNFYRHFDFLA